MGISRASVQRPNPVTGDAVSWLMPLNRNFSHIRCSHLQPRMPHYQSHCGHLKTVSLNIFLCRRGPRVNFVCACTIHSDCCTIPSKSPPWGPVARSRRLHPLEDASMVCLEALSQVKSSTSWQYAPVPPFCNPDRSKRNRPTLSSVRKQQMMPICLTDNTACPHKR